MIGRRQEREESESVAVFGVCVTLRQVSIGGTPGHSAISILRGNSAISI